MIARVSAVELEAKIRKADPLEVIIALTTRLALAIDRLRRIAEACPACGGSGETGESYAAHTMTDDPRLIGRPHARRRRALIRKFGATVAKLACGAGTLKTRCAACAPIRDTIRICEASEE